MDSRNAGVRPVSGRGLLFLVAFVSFLALAFLGPHAHGVDTVPAAPGSVSAEPGAAAELQASGLAAAASPAAASPAAAASLLQGVDASLGFAAVCVLVLLLTFALFAMRAAPQRAVAQRSPLPLPLRRVPQPRAPARPLFLLLSISRT